MNGGDKNRYGRGAQELNLRPFAAPAGEEPLPLNTALPVSELLDIREPEPGERRPRREKRKGDTKPKAARAKGQAGAGKRGPSLTQREKIALERQRKFNRFLTLCVAAVVALAALLLTWFVLIVDEIEVAGNERLSAEEIIAASGLKTGRHTWLSNLAQARARIEEDPYIETAEIVRAYPDKLVVSVKERTEAAVIVGLNAQAVIDPKGYVLSIGARADYTGLIRVSGMGFGGYHIGQRLGEESDFNSRTLVEILAALYGAGIEADIDLVDMSNPLSVSMTTTLGLTLHIGQPDGLEQKLADYLAVLPELQKLGLANSGALDLGAMGDPVYSPAEQEPEDPQESPLPEDSPSPEESPSPDESPSSDESPSPGVSPSPGEPFSG